MGTRDAPPRRRRFAPALVTDLPVALAVIVCWLVVPVVWAHVATGLGLVLLVVVHLRTRPGLARRLWHSPRRPVVRASSWFVIAATVAVTGTGLLRWAGSPPEQTWHGGTAWMLLTAILVHLYLMRHRLRSRLRTGGEPR